MDLEPEAPTMRQRLACVKRTGRPFQARPFEEVLDVKNEPTRITVLVKCVKMTETSRGWNITGTGRKLIWWDRQDDGTWLQDSIAMWDEVPDAVFVREMGKSVTPEMHKAAMQFALDCYRPGTDRAPLDNAERTFEHREYTTPKMLSHWER